MKNRKFLIFGFIFILVVTAAFLYIATKMKDNLPLVCREDVFEVFSYSHGYNPNEQKNYLFISTQSDVDGLLNIFTPTAMQELDIEKNDYIIYFLNPQAGCDREMRLNCVTFGKNKLTLNMTKFEVDPTCDRVINDSLVIELEKGKFNKDVEIKLEVEEDQQETK